MMAMTTSSSTNVNAFRSSAGTIGMTTHFPDISSSKYWVCRDCIHAGATQDACSAVPVPPPDFCAIRTSSSSTLHQSGRTCGGCSMPYTCARTHPCAPTAQSRACIVLTVRCTRCALNNTQRRCRLYGKGICYGSLSAAQISSSDRRVAHWPGFHSSINAQLILNEANAVGAMNFIDVDPANCTKDTTTGW